MMGRISKKDFRRLANNSGAALADMQQRGQSLAACFDALVTVLDREFEAMCREPISVALKAELERRANAVQAGNKR